MLPVLESLFYKDAGLCPATLLKMTSAQVFSCKFREIFKKIFFTEHLWTTASAIPCKHHYINTFWELAFSKYLLEELLANSVLNLQIFLKFLKEHCAGVSFLINLKLFLKRDSAQLLSINYTNSPDDCSWVMSRTF